MKKFLLLAAWSLPFIAGFAQKDNYLLVGTYTEGKSQGIYVFHFNSESGDFDSVSMMKTTNPSFLAISPDEKFVYAVNELTNKGNGGKVVAYAFNKTDGKLSLIDEQPSKGDDPCYVSVDKTGKWLAVANYTSGTLAILPINKDGGLGAATTVIQHHGSSVDKERQEGPHVHCVVFSSDNKYLFAADLGLDKLMAYPFKKGKLDEARAATVQTAAGTGPRHFTFDPNNQYAYLIQEMGGVVSAYQYWKGKLKWLQNISSLPAGFKGPVTSADIHVSPDGNFLYASNRDPSNTIAIFKIDRQTGMLTLVGHQSTLGRTPRNFNFDPSGNFLLVANQNNDEIVVFKIDRTTGMLTDSGKRIHVGKPVCIKWIAP